MTTYRSLLRSREGWRLRHGPAVAEVAFSLSLLLEVNHFGRKAALGHGFQILHLISKILFHSKITYRSVCFAFAAMKPKSQSFLEM